jgi:hypothetical protein
MESVAVLVRTIARTALTASESEILSLLLLPILIEGASASRKLRVSETESLKIILTCKRSEKTRVSLTGGAVEGANLLVPSVKEKESVTVTVRALMER